MIPDKCPWCGDAVEFDYPERETRWWYCRSNCRRQSKRCQMNELEILWRVRMALTEIGWVARCDYERTMKFNEGYDVGFSQARLGSLIGTGGDTK